MKPESISVADWLDLLLTGIRSNLICHQAGIVGPKFIEASIELVEAALEAIGEVPIGAETNAPTPVSKSSSEGLGDGRALWCSGPPTSDPLDKEPSPPAPLRSGEAPQGEGSEQV